jgi:hypothetical protein
VARVWFLVWPQSCGGTCFEGYYCPAGSVNGTAFQCGNASVVCPAGSAAPAPVQPGFYSVGGATAATRNAQVACPVGTYCQAGELIDCPVGRWGNNVTGSSTICPNVCSDGFSCPARSISPSTCGSVDRYCVGGLQLAVPPGSYSTPESAAVDQRSGVAVCPMGSYCVGGVRTLCAAGRFGATTGLTVSDCSGQCPAGYFCPQNSTSGTARLCGSVAVYCPVGSGAALSVSVGFYSSGSVSVTNRTSQTECEAGFFCVAGVRTACPAGRFSALTGWSSNCTNVCPAGYFCPQGTSSAFAFPCGSADKYCPAGSAVALAVPTGAYSTPVTTAATNRTGVAYCTPGTYCLSGVQYVCPAGRFGAAANSSSPVRRFVARVLTGSAAGLLPVV